MHKKISILLIIFSFLLTFVHFSYATDVVMDLNSSANQSTSNTNVNDNSTVQNTTVNDTEAGSTQAIDNTIYSSDQSTSDDAQIPTTSAVTTEESEDSGELSISNMINIVLIVVGIVLVLLGIAIIIRLK